MSIETKPSLKKSTLITLCFIMLVWLIKAIEIAFNLSFIEYGLYPRNIDMLPGILTAPLIHSSFEHLFANTLPLFVLSMGMLYNYPKSVKYTIPIIYLGSGFCVWIFARESFHIGASGLTHGMMFFLFIAGILRTDKASAALALIVFFLYGGMIASILPTQEHISFESHLFGALIGTICAFLFRDYDPKKPEKKYSWEQTTDELDESQ